MSRHADTVKRIVDLYNRLPSDTESRASSPELAKLVSFFDPAMEFRLDPQVVGVKGGGENVSGRRSFRASYEDWILAWEGHRSQIVEIVERHPRVLLLVRDRYQARDGVEVESEGATIFTFKDEKIARVDAFADHERARRKFEAGGSAASD
jgi:ketosteroid isomerase-like protein